MTERRRRPRLSLRQRWLALLLVLLAPATSVAADDLVLQAREQRPWNLPADLERVAIADPGVADIVMLRGQRQALLVGKMPGTPPCCCGTADRAEPTRG